MASPDCHRCKLHPSAGKPEPIYRGLCTPCLALGAENRVSRGVGTTINHNQNSIDLEPAAID